METSNLIASIALLVAALSAIYAKRAVKHAARANKIAVQNALRPDRLAVRDALIQFLDFCAKYRNLQSLHKTKDTEELPEQLDRFHQKISQYGPLGMADVEELITETERRAKKLQRILSRLRGVDPRPVDSAYETAEENVYAIEDWFDTQGKQVQSMFEKHLKII